MSKESTEILTSQKEEAIDAETRFHVKRIIEALLFASSEPLPFEKIRQTIHFNYSFKPRVLRLLIEELQQDYVTQRSAFRLEELGQGFVLRTCEDFRPYIEALFCPSKKEKISRAATEVLVIIAYRQPITRAQVEAIRGVDSSGSIQSLINRGLIAPVDRQEEAGRSTLYGTTSEFLQHFGLKALNELPKLESIINNR